MGIVAGASTVAVFSIIIVIICAAGGRTGLLMIYVFAVHRNDIVSERQRERERESETGGGGRAISAWGSSQWALLI